MIVVITSILIIIKIKLILAQRAVTSSASLTKSDKYRTNVLGHCTGVGGDGGGRHHGERADEDQEELEEDHLGAG